MKFHYYSETDSLYIDLSQKSSAESIEVAEGVVLDFDMNGKLITPFIIKITGKDEEMTIETDVPLEAEYMVTLCKYPEFLAQEIKKAQAWVRKNKMKIVED